MLTHVIDDLIYRIGWSLLDSVWIGTAVAISLAIVLRAGRNSSSNARYVWCCVAMIAIVLGMIASACVHAPSRAPVTHANGLVGTSPQAKRALMVAPPSSRSSSMIDAERALPAVVGLWSCGVIAIAAWQLIGWELLRRFRRQAQAAPAEWCDRLRALATRMRVRRVVLAISNRLNAPIVIGVFEPVILVPLSIFSELSPMQVQAILAHELAHIRRHDYLINLIQIAIETLLFYHPAVWWISKQIRRERECACDAIAAEVCGSRTDYAQALASLEASRGARLALSIQGNGKGSELLVRVRRLLMDPIKLAPGRRSFPSLPVLLLVAASLLAIGIFNQLVAQPASPTSHPLSTTQPSDRLLQMRFGSALARMQSASQQLNETNMQIMQMELTLGEKHPTLMQLKKAAVQLDAKYRAAKHEAVELEKAAVEKGINLDESTVTTKPTTAPTATTQRSQKTVHVIVGWFDIYLEGQTSDLDQLQKVIEAIPAEQRAQVSIQVSAASPRVESGRFTDVFLKVLRMSKAAGLAPVAVGDVEADPPEGEQLTGEYYMGGEIERVGVYSLTARKISLKMALISAGMTKTDPSQCVVTLVRHGRDGKQMRPVDNLPVSDLLDGKAEDPILRPDDQIMVSKAKPK